MTYRRSRAGTTGTGCSGRNRRTSPPSSATSRRTPATDTTTKKTTTKKTTRTTTLDARMDTDESSDDEDDARGGRRRSKWGGSTKRSRNGGDVDAIAALRAKMAAQMALEAERTAKTEKSDSRAPSSTETREERQRRRREDEERRSAALEASAAALDTDDAKSWTDFCKACFHPRSHAILPGLWRGVDLFAGFGEGVEHLRTEERREEARDAVRFWAEECDHLRGFQVFAEDLSGFGGVAATVLEELRDEYGTAPVTLFSLRPPTRINSRVFNGCEVPGVQVRAAERRARVVDPRAHVRRVRAARDAGSIAGIKVSSGVPRGRYLSLGGVSRGGHRHRHLTVEGQRCVGSLGGRRRDVVGGQALVRAGRWALHRDDRDDAVRRVRRPERRSGSIRFQKARRTKVSGWRGLVAGVQGERHVRRGGR